MLGGVKLDNTLLTCDQSNFNQITARSMNQTLLTVVRDMCTTTVPPAPLFRTLPLTKTLEQTSKHCTVNISFISESSSGYYEMITSQLTSQLTVNCEVIIS